MLQENILDLVPQRAPFLMVDGILESDEKKTITSFHIKEDNILVKDGKFSEAGLIENIAQTAAARAGYIVQQENMPVMIGYIGAIKDLQIFNLPKISDNLETEIIIKNQIFDVTLISGTVRCNGVVMAQCEMKIFIIKPT